MEVDGSWGRAMCGRDWEYVSMSMQDCKAVTGVELRGLGGVASDV